jgi:hypothetical protein
LPYSAFALTSSGYWQTEDKQTVIEFNPCAEALRGYLAFTGVETGAKDEKNSELLEETLLLKPVGKNEFTSCDS